MNIIVINIAIIGPFPPPASGTTIKNRILATALEGEGVVVHEISTVEKNFSLILAVLKFSFSKQHNLIISVSKNGRMLFIPYGFFLKKIFNKKVILMPCGGTMSSEIKRMNTFFKFFYNAFCRSFDCIFVETKAMSLSLKNVIGNGRIERLPNFKVRPQSAPKKRVSSKSLRLVYLGRLRENKGILNLLEAVRIISEAGRFNVTLDIYGDFLKTDHALEIKFHTLIQDSEVVSFHGYLAPSKINSVLQAYDALVFPTFFETEGFPGVLVDAAFAGLPVIATDIAYNSEIVQHDINGLLCEANNPASLRLAIEHLAINEQKRILMGKKNWDFSDDYCSKKSALKILKIFEK